MKAPFVAAVLILFFASTSVRASERVATSWQIDVKASYVVLGANAARATGGFMPSLTGSHLWSIHEVVDIGLGADVGVFGLGGIGRWIGVLGGPTSVLRVSPFTIPFSFEFGARFDVGRIPVCNPWGLCLRYIGFFPSVEAGVAYQWFKHLTVSAMCGARIVQTLAWSGVAVEPALAGRFSW